MTSSHSEPEYTNIPICVEHAAQAIRATLYRIKCEELVSTWYALLGYDALDEWFDSNRCCIPITLSRILDPRIIKDRTTI